MRRIIKKLYILGPVALLFALALPNPAHAAWWNPLEIIAQVVIWIIQLIQLIGILFLALATMVLSKMLELNYSILSNNSLIETGWTIVRDLTNLGFVLVIIVIAISTIIRYEKYAMKALLPKLIGAAIVVNFSLTIAGVFIDFSHSMTRFFFEPLLGQGTFGIKDTISSAFQPQALLTDADNIEYWQPESGAGWLTGPIIKIAGAVFSLIFTFMAAFVVGALAVMFFLRYLNLSFLLILAPIVWLFWVVPAFNKYHGDWWQAFMKWIIFGPAASFFIYLSLVSMEQLGEATANSENAAAFFNDGGLAAIMKHGVNMFVLTGFFFGSLIVAQKVGVAGASGAMGLANKAKGSAKGAAKKAAGNYAKQRAKNLRDSALSLGQQTNEKGETTTWAERKMSGLANNKILRHMPIAGGMLRAGQNTLAKQKAGRATATAEAQKSLAELSLDDLKARASLRTLAPTERAALGMEFIKRGKLDELKDGTGLGKKGRFANKTKTEVLNAIQQTNNVKNAISINPLLAEQLLDLEKVKENSKGQITTDQQARDYVVKEAAKKLTAEKAAALDDLALADKRVMANVSTGVMSRLANEGLDKMEKAQKTLDDIIKDAQEDPEVKKLAQRNLRALLHTPTDSGRTSNDSKKPEATPNTTTVAGAGDAAGGHTGHFDDMGNPVNA